MKDPFASPWHPRWCWVYAYHSQSCTCGAEARACRILFDNVLAILRVVIPLAAAEQRGREEVRAEWQDYAWERSERD